MFAAAALSLITDKINKELLPYRNMENIIIANGFRDKSGQIILILTKLPIMNRISNIK